MGWCNGGDLGANEAVGPTISPAYIRKIKPSQAVLNALGLHAAVPPPPTSSSTFAFHPRRNPTPRFPFRSENLHLQPSLLSTDKSGNGSNSASTSRHHPGAWPVLTHSLRAPSASLRFCLSNISYIKAQPRPLYARRIFLQNITNPVLTQCNTIAGVLFLKKRFLRRWSKWYQNTVSLHSTCELLIRSGNYT